MVREFYSPGSDCYKRNKPAWWVRVFPMLTWGVGSTGRPANCTDSSRTQTTNQRIKVSKNYELKESFLPIEKNLFWSQKCGSTKFAWSCSLWRNEDIQQVSEFVTKKDSLKVLWTKKNLTTIAEWDKLNVLREFEIIFRMFVRRNVGILSYDFGRTPCSSICQNQSLPFTHRCPVSGHGQQRQKSNSSQYWHSKLACERFTLSSNIPWNRFSLSSYWKSWYHGIFWCDRNCEKLSLTE